MLTAKRSAGVTPEVNLWEHVTSTHLPSTNKAAHSGFETQRRRHQKSKTGVSHVLQKLFKKRKKNKLSRQNWILSHQQRLRVKCAEPAIGDSQQHINVTFPSQTSQGDSQISMIERTFTHNKISLSVAEK